MLSKNESISTGIAGISKENTIDIPRSYDDNLTWEQKTIFGLYKCTNSAGFVLDIINSLSSYDKAINKDDQKVFAAITTKASILGRRGWFKRQNVAGRYKYSIK